MTTLDELFPDGPRRVRGAVNDDHHTLRRLDEMFGAPRAAARTARTDVDALVRTARDAQEDAVPVALPAKPASASRSRSRVRRDPVNIAAAVLAVGAMVAAGVLGTVQAANANPAAGALRSLQQSQADVEDLAQGVRDTYGGTADRIAGALSDAAALRAVLVVIASGTTTGSDSIPIAAPDVVQGAIDEVDGYASALHGIALPALPQEQSPVGVDERSLTAIASAADAAQVQREAWQQSAALLASASAQTDELVAAHERRRDLFAGTFVSGAAQLVADHPGAPRTARDAVVSAAGRIAETRLAGVSGAAAVAAYREAVAALLEGRAVESTGRGVDTGTGGPTPAPTDAPVPSASESPVNAVPRPAPTTAP